MTKIEFLLLISLGVLFLVFIFLNIKDAKDTLSPKNGLSIVICVFLCWGGYSLYKMHELRQQMEQLSGNLQNSLSNLSGALGKNDREQDKSETYNEEHKKIALGDHKDGGIVFWVDESGEHGLMADDHDLREMNWEEAKSACAAKGNGWHLPTKEELQKLYKNKDKVSGLKIFSYWSSSEFNSSGAWEQNFSSGPQNLYYKSSTFYVRAVRAF